MSSKFKLFFLASAPTLITVLLAIIFIAPKQISGLSAIMPLIHLVPIYIWSVLHARHMPVWSTAMIGLVVDSAVGLPFGLSALIYCSLIILIRSQRKYILKEGFMGMWGYFSLMILLTQLSFWIILSFMYGQTAPIANALLQATFSILAYPLLHGLLYPLVDKIADSRYRLLHA
jgi:rod shape-determining protein MreD